MLESYLKQLDLCYFELSEAFKGLSDDHVWVRPGTGLLSVGEIAGHIAYWEAVRFAGSLEDGSSPRDLLGCKIISPLAYSKDLKGFIRKSNTAGVDRNSFYKF